MIGIIVAMPLEAVGLKSAMTNKESNIISSIEFVKGKLHGIDCVLVICGPGKVNAAICTQTMILEYSPKFIINTGVAGAIGKDIHIGDIVIAKDVVQHDVDTTGLGDPKGFISGIKVIKINCCEKISQTIYKILKDQHFGSNIHVGTIATGDQFIESREKKEMIYNDFNALVCDMECGSIGQVCYMHNVDFVSIKAMSDNANESAELNFNEFAAEVAKSYVDLINAFFLKMKSEENNLH